MANMTLVKTINRQTPTMIDKLVGFVFGDSVINLYDPTQTYTPDDYIFMPTDDGGIMFYQCVEMTTGEFDINSWKPISVMDIMGSGTVISETRPIGYSTSTWLKPISYSHEDVESLIPEMSPASLIYSIDYVNNIAHIASYNEGTFNGIVATPKTIEGYPLYYIDTNAFLNVRGITKLYITDNILSIGAGAFMITNTDETDTLGFLTDVVFGYGLTSIPTSAFSGQIKLTSVDFPGTIESISELAFNGCTSIKTVSLRNRYTSIADTAFDGCTALTTVYGYPNSTAEEFATAKGLTFISL